MTRDTNGGEKTSATTPPVRGDTAVESRSRIEDVPPLWPEGPDGWLAHALG